MGFICVDATYGLKPTSDRKFNWLHFAKESRRRLLPVPGLVCFTSVAEMNLVSFPASQLCARWRRWQRQLLLRSHNRLSWRLTNGVIVSWTTVGLHVVRKSARQLAWTSAHRGHISIAERHDRTGYVWDALRPIHIELNWTDWTFFQNVELPVSLVSFNPVHFCRADVNGSLTFDGIGVRSHRRLADICEWYRETA